MSRFQFVADHSGTSGPGWSVKRLCALLDVRRTSFYAWKAAAPARAARAAADAQLAQRIATVHAADTTCGRPRITARAQRRRPTAAAGQPQAGRAGHARARHPRLPPTPQRPHHHPRARRHGRARPAGPGLHRHRSEPCYVGDIAYLPLAGGGNLYLATVIDCFSRRLVGWSVADHMRTELVEDALRAAASTRGSLAGAIFHSDHGSVYTSRAYARLCDQLGVTRSMGAVGSSADNALAESFNATVKREVLQDTRSWPDEPTCRRELFRWLTRYNTRRRHSWCRYQTPNTYEQTYAATVPAAA